MDNGIAFIRFEFLIIVLVSSACLFAVIYNAKKRVADK